MGNALAGRLLKSARLAGVDLRTRTAAGSLIEQHGVVTGLVVKGAQGERRIGARRSEGWQPWRLEADGIARLAAGDA